MSGLEAAIIPLIIGAGAAGIGALRGSKEPKKVSLLDQQQQDLRQRLIDGLGGQGQFANLFSTDPQQTAKLFNESVAQPLTTQFNEEILPSITGQFRGANIGNSTFAGQAGARAGEGLERQLASALANMQQGELSQARQNALQAISGLISQKTFGFINPQPDIIDQVLSGIAGQGIKTAGGIAQTNFGG